MFVEYGVIGILVVVIAAMAYKLYRRDKTPQPEERISLEHLEDEFDDIYHPLIEEIKQKDNTYEIVTLLLKEIQQLQEKCALFETEIDTYKLEHSKAVQSLEQKTHEIIHISHQMRTSLSGLLGFTQFLQSTKLTEEQEEFVSIIATSSDELLHLVNNIIEMSPKPRKKSSKDISKELPPKRPLKDGAPNVLVVDDNDINKKLLSKVLEKENLNVTYASNGQEAVALRKENNFDIIFMDIQMPVMDGVEASRAIREYETELSLSPVPIVALTANTSKEDKDLYLSAGMTDYMAKPIMIEDVRKRIAQL